MEKPQKFYSKFCSHLRKNNLYRRLHPFDAKKSSSINFSHNDYLNLTKQKRLIQASSLASKTWGVGSKGSRLLSGNTPLHVELETLISQTKQKEKTLIFSSGFQANVTTLASLLNSKIFLTKPLVFADRLNHASIHLGCHLSKVKQMRYNHLDMNHLVDLLKKHHNSKQPKFILTESLFSMEGDTINIEEITSIAQKFSAFLYIDDSHAIGTFGTSGYGITEGYEDKIDLIMGSFSKALGTSGGFITTDKETANYLINTSSGFIYSTAHSPSVVGATLESWKLLPKCLHRRKSLERKSAFLRRQLKQCSFDIGNSKSHIIPLILKEEQKVLTIKEKLQKEGIIVSAIRPPTVPYNQSRIRLSVSSSHTYSQLNQLIKVLQTL